MSSTLTLPKYVAFKGFNQKYLCVRQAEFGLQLQFVADDISDPTATMEMIVTSDGNFQIKNTSSGKILNLGPYNYIVADADDTSIEKNTLFRPFKVNSNSIALLNMGNSKFCGRHTDNLLANIDLTTKYAWLMVEEPIKKREISDIKYYLDQSKIYDDETIILDEKSATNPEPDFESPVDLTLTYINVQTTIWNTIHSMKLEAKNTFVVNFPIIDNGKVKLSDELQELNELDEIRVTNNVVEVVKHVVVPPMTRTTVTLVAKKSKCDVPFTFTQRDTPYIGHAFTIDMEGETYTGSNYYNLEYRTKEDPVDTRI